MSLLKAGEGAANYNKFPVTCVVDILQFSVIATCPNMGARKGSTAKGTHPNNKAPTLFLPRLLTASTTVTSSFVMDCHAVVIGLFALSFVGRVTVHRYECKL